MRQVMGWAVALAVLVAGAAAADRCSAAAVGPQGPVGPDVRLSAAEKDAFAKQVAVEAKTDQGVQAACDSAVDQGIATVYLPAGRYVFRQQVKVPAGLTVLGAGAKTVCLAGDRKVHLFDVAGDGVRFTRLRLQGADSTISDTNDTYGINVAGKRNVRIDHCELVGFSYATNFADEATAQVDHCHIHHNLRGGLGYGVAIYSGAYVLVCDNRFGQNRHSLASNGTLDWSSPKRVGKYLHRSGGRKTHWEFLRNYVGTNDQAKYELCAVDTHPGMDGTFVVEGNVFEGVRLGVGIRDGAGLIRGNVFRNLQSSQSRNLTGIYVGYGTHNNVPVDGCMPNNIQIQGNVFLMEPGAKYEPYAIEKAENVTIDGKLVPSTKATRPAPPMPRLKPMGDDGVLNWTDAGPRGG